MSRNYTYNHASNSIFSKNKKRPRGRIKLYLTMLILLAVIGLLAREIEIKQEVIEKDITNEVINGEFTK